MISDNSSSSKDSSNNNGYDRFSLRWGGAAGDGLRFIGILLQKYFNRLGYYVQGFPGTQSTIRGGHVWQHIEFSTQKFGSFDSQLDLLIAFNSVTLDVHLHNLKKHGIDRYRNTIENSCKRN
ncbi:MAG: 2-oxoacid:acceptor oxidoreductase family protein [Candidatus Hodarchaeales archaeon]|jgi:2-oxoglutarate ferredoxin oxidoreductase subunit alpha